jgi:hypothetical protein
MEAVKVKEWRVSSLFGNETLVIRTDGPAVFRAGDEVATITLSVGGQTGVALACEGLQALVDALVEVRAEL